MIKIGLAGVGGMGAVHHSNYAHIAGCRVAAAVGQSDRDRETAAAWGIPLYESLGEMLSMEEIDAVDVCTPTFLHKEHVLAAIKYGKPVVCEKPVALNLPDAREMFNAAKVMGVCLYVGQVLRFYPESRVLAALVKSGEYGRILDARFERLSGCPAWVQGGWMFDKSKSGLLPFDLHIHDLDLIVSLFGKPKDFHYTSCGNEGKSYKEHYRFQYDFDSFHVSAEAAWFNAPFPFTARWQVYFENAVVVNDGRRVIAYQNGREPRLFDTEEKIKIPTGINLPPTGVFLEELTHFMECIRENRPSQLITEEQVLTVVEILAAIEA